MCRSGGCNHLHRHWHKLMLQVMRGTLKGTDNVVEAVVGVACKALVGARERVDNIYEDARGVDGTDALRQACPFDVQLIQHLAQPLFCL